jgi:hypothetical protein
MPVLLKKTKPEMKNLVIEYPLNFNALSAQAISNKEKACIIFAAVNFQGEQN